MKSHHPKMNKSGVFCTWMEKTGHLLLSKDAVHQGLLLRVLQLFCLRLIEINGDSYQKPSLEIVLIMV